MPSSLFKIEIDDKSLPSPSAEADHSRSVAIFDMIETADFTPNGAEDAGISAPFGLRLSLLEQRLCLDIYAKSGVGEKRIMLSLSALKPLLRDYAMVCESYTEALRGASVGQIESIDMGRRGLHNEGADLLIERLKDKVSLSHETARRFFSLLYALKL